MWTVRFSQGQCWGFKFFEMLRCVIGKVVSNVSEALLSLKMSGTSRPMTA